MSGGERDALLALLHEYLDLVTHGGDDAVARLELLLDRLALAVAEAQDVFDEADHPDPVTASYEMWRERACATFPDFGHYNVARPVTTDIAAAELMVGDAIDDIADIAKDLEEVSLRWSQSRDDAIWHFKHMYLQHWGEHLRSLQLYLHMNRYDW